MSYNETDTCWHILTVTKGGVVSILKNLDAPTARKAYQSLAPSSQPVENINWPSEELINRESFASRFSLRDDHFSQVTVIGPECMELDPWRGVPPRLLDMTASWVHGGPVFIESADRAMSMEDAQEVHEQNMAARRGGSVGFTRLGAGHDR